MQIVGAWHERMGGREQLGAVQFMESRTNLPRVLLSQSACSAALVDGAIDLIWKRKALPRSEDLYRFLHSASVAPTPAHHAACTVGTVDAIIVQSKTWSVRCCSLFFPAPAVAPYGWGPVHRDGGHLTLKSGLCWKSLVCAYP